VRLLLGDLGLGELRWKPGSLNDQLQAGPQGVAGDLGGVLGIESALVQRGQRSLEATCMELLCFRLPLMSWEATRMAAQHPQQ